MWLKSFILEPTSLLGGDPRACQRLTTCIWQLGRLNCFQCTKPPGSYISSKPPSNDILIPTFPDCSTTSTKVHTLYICELTVIQQPNRHLYKRFVKWLAPTSSALSTGTNTVAKLEQGSTSA